MGPSFHVVYIFFAVHTENQSSMATNSYICKMNISQDYTYRKKALMCSVKIILNMN